MTGNPVTDSGFLQLLHSRVHSRDTASLHGAQKDTVAVRKPTIEEGRMSIEKPLFLGQARVDITPPVNISMCGHDEYSFTGLKDRLYATAIVCCQGKTKVCLISADLIGFRKIFTNEVRRRIAKLLKVGRANIVLCATHTHTGPDVLWPLQAKNNIGYINKLKARLIYAARKAERTLVQGTVGAGVGKVTIGINRRWRVGGKILFAPNPQGVYDRDVMVVKLAMSGKLAGLILSHACHPTAEPGRIISADYPGPIREYLERKYGGDVKVSFLLGCCGNVRPNGRYRKGKFTPLTKRQIAAFNREVIRINRAIVCEKNPKLSFVHSKVNLPLDMHRIKLEKLKKWHAELTAFVKKEGITERDPKGRHNHLRELKGLSIAIRMLERGQKIAPVPMDVALLKVGRIIFAFLPGEVFTEIGMQIKRLRRDCVVIPVSIYNIIVPYLCTEKACQEGGFEPNSQFWMIYPFPWSGKCERIIVRKMASLMKRL